MHHDIHKDIAKAVKIIEADGVISFPTGTVYGLAVNALSCRALANLRKTKQRPREKTFTVCMASSLRNDFLRLNEKERSALSKLKNTPVTLLVKPQASLAHLAQEGYIGLRMIDHPLMQSLVEAVSYPLTATSANLSGREACLSPECVKSQLSSVSFILDGGQLPSSPASTIARLEGGDIVIIRAGSLSQEDLQAILL